jgi:hypothetical protein
VQRLVFHRPGRVFGLWAPCLGGRRARLEQRLGLAPKRIKPMRYTRSSWKEFRICVRAIFALGASYKLGERYASG